ncbi:hypothetical protein E2C01_010921 [Portunus trituberculatus]|uniref:Secreted protein n=1 Tax=Portunus trituberculatus TaxID=210409 RepID=A0A5B7D9M9_PORTR|nr:hypothetical protein [Portunus trituberculatus]
MLATTLLCLTFHILLGNLGGWVEAECLSRRHHLGPVDSQVDFPILGGDLKRVCGGNVAQKRSAYSSSRSWSVARPAFLRALISSLSSHAPRTNSSAWGKECQCDNFKKAVRMVTQTLG